MARGDGRGGYRPGCGRPKILNGPTRRLSAHVVCDQYEDFEAFARSRRWSMSELARTAISEYIEQQRGENNEAA